MAQAHHTAAEAPHEVHHPGPGVYVFVALVLAVVTAVELVIIYTGLSRLLMVTTLLVMSAGKFYTVAMFFMHLRYDNQMYSIIFGGGIALTVAILTSLFALFGIIK